MISLRAPASLVVLVAVMVTPVHAQVLPPSVYLDRYASGTVTAAADWATQHDNFADLAARLRRSADDWIEATGDVAAPRRRQIAAMFVLEAVRTQRWERWPAARGLLEWQCARLRARAPGPVERAWHLAAAALMQGAMDGRMLAQHVSHVRAGFPNEPRLRLAEALISEWSTWPGTRDTPSADRIPLADAVQQRAAARRVVLYTQAIDAYRPLIAVAEIQNDVRLRIGHLEMRLGHLDRALEEFGQVSANEQSTDLRYLALFFTGQAHEAQARRDAAREDYRAALRLRPGTPSAALALASLLFDDNARDEAAQLADEALRARSADPWRSFGLGDYWRVSTYIDAGRAALR